MRHARPAVAVAALLALPACAGDDRYIPPDNFELTRQTRQTEAWPRHLPQLYGGLTACLHAHPQQPAFATDVVPQNDMVLVDVVGADGSHVECSTNATGSQPAKLSPSSRTQPGAAVVSTPNFTPIDMPEPLVRCGSNHPVFHRDGKPLGWVTFFREDCEPEGPAAQSNWRAFGNEPFWNIRIGPDSIVFDRLGALPLQYPSRAPRQRGNRWIWELEPPYASQPEKLELTIVNVPCGDSMADRRHDYRAEAVYGGQRLQGCAEKLSAIP